MEQIYGIHVNAMAEVIFTQSVHNLLCRLKVVEQYSCYHINISAFLPLTVFDATCDVPISVRVKQPNMLVAVI